MQELRELINIALGWRTKRANTINYIRGSKKSLANKLISDIYDGKINTDEEAEKALYGEEPNPVAYKKLKERLRERLLTNILFVQSNLRNEKTFAYNIFFCHKYYVIAMLLIKVSHYAAGTTLMQRVLIRAQKFHVNNIALLAASLLRKLCVQQGDAKRFNKYSEIVKHYHAVIKAEDEADELHDRLMMHFAHSYAPKPELIPAAAEAVAYIGTLKNAFGTFELHLLHFLVRNLHAQLTDNYTLAVAVCNEFEEYFFSKPAFYSKGRHGNITMVKIDSLLCAGIYDEALRISKETMPLFESMEGNRLIMLELQFVIALRIKDIALAAACYKQLMAVAGSKNAYAHRIEIWQILGGYLWLCLNLEDSATIIAETFGSKKAGFMQRLQQMVTIYSKDKQGVNISLGFLQFSMLLQQQDFSAAIDKAEQLKMYMYKYISRRFGAREFTFLKLMLLLTKHNFNVKAVERNAKIQLKKLESLPVVAFAYNNQRVEILEYKQLWELIIAAIKKHSPVIVNN
ncbi:MAG: hypothetical protein EOP53_05235 [Sphingobacteriales bacterium]|nr:MAG: hypothetical protein EOP53_05235 [Sphingobacteriales bacterium]